MKLTRLCSAILVLTLAGTAHASFVATGLLRIDDDPSNGNVLQCTAVNTGKKDIELVITAALNDFEIVPPHTLGPGQRSSAYNANDTASPKMGYCRFNVISGKKKDLRGAACALDEHTNCRAALPAN